MSSGNVFSGETLSSTPSERRSEGSSGDTAQTRTAPANSATITATYAKRRMMCEYRTIECCCLPNDVRIDCKAAKHSDGDRGAVLAYLEAELREPRRPPSVDCSSRPTGRRANKRRVVNLLQQLAGVNSTGKCNGADR